MPALIEIDRIGEKKREQKREIRGILAMNQKRSLPLRHTISPALKISSQNLQICPNPYIFQAHITSLKNRQHQL